MWRVSIEIWPADPKLDLVSVKGETRLQRFAASEVLWKWVDAHETELGVGRPYLDRDPPHVGPVDGREYAAKRGRSPVRKVANNDSASGVKSTVSTQPPAHEGKKIKREIRTVSRPRGSTCISAHDSSGAQTRPCG